MKQRTVIGFLSLVLIAISGSANAGFIVGDDNYIGYTENGAPADAQEEADRINFLIDMLPGETTNPCSVDEICSRVGSTLDTSGFVDAVIAGYVKNDDTPLPASGPNVTGFTYLLGKYGGIAHVWQVGDLTGFQTLPGLPPGSDALSHWSLFNFDDSTGCCTTVPEPGTMGLFAISLLGLGLSRRFRIKLT